mmetsp:Transcript_15622/g.25361  ORF Transcript_15622/g.25361 Transcript_15622/m.25361 type:complete len:231 (-) Transcript_15622:630-1322(-)
MTSLACSSESLKPNFSSPCLNSANVNSFFCSMSRQRKIPRISRTTGDCCSIDSRNFSLTAVTSNCPLSLCEGAVRESSCSSSSFSSFSTASFSLLPFSSAMIPILGFLKSLFIQYCFLVCVSAGPRISNWWLYTVTVLPFFMSSKLKRPPVSMFGCAPMSKNLPVTRSLFRVSSMDNVPSKKLKLKTKDLFSSLDSRRTASKRRIFPRPRMKLAKFWHASAISSSAFSAA